MTQKITAILLVSFAFACQSGDPIDTQASPIAQALADSLRGQAIVGTTLSPIDYRIEQLSLAVPTGLVNVDGCRVIDEALWGACEIITGTGLASACYTKATFFFANNTPRCSVRVQLFDDDPNAFDTLIAFDLDGADDDTPDECGNGVLDPGEQCDDGNRDPFDGCDASCLEEGFNGCEGIIEYHYKLAEIAEIDQNLWQGPRSQLMVHHDRIAMRPMSQQVCTQALATGSDVCREIAATMPFANYCEPRAEYLTATNQCAVRLLVYFNQLDAASGVFTTGMPGILAFTL